MVLEITSEQHLETYLTATPIVVVDFFATWCPPCRMVGPELETWDNAIASSLPEDSSRVVSFCKVDVDKFSDLSQRYNVTSMPTFLIFVDGKQEAVVVGANMRGLREAVARLQHTVDQSAPVLA